MNHLFKYLEPIVKFAEKHLVFFLAILAVVPRLPLMLRDMIHYDSGGVVYVLDDLIKKHQYFPSRHPGSPVAEFSFSLLRMFADTLTIPAHFFTNFFAVGFTVFFYFYAIKLMRKWFTFAQALLFVFIFNLHPQMIIYAGATSDMPMLLGFMATSIYFYEKKQFGWAFFLALLGCWCRMQGLALLLPMLFFWFWQTKSIARFLACAGIFATMWIPGFIVFGWTVFFPGMHHATEVTSFQKLVAAIYRILNIMGPVGTLMVVGLLINASTKGIFKWKLLLNSIYFWLVLMTGAIFRFAPMEAYYLLPALFVLLAFCYWLVLKMDISKVIVTIFLVSFLSNNFVQVRIRFWKLPLMQVLPGVIEAHYRELWVIRGGG